MIERRREDRKDQTTLNLELKKGVTGNSSIVVPVLCISEKGLSFYVPADKFKLREGDTLNNIRLFNKQHDEFIEKSQIVYSIKVEMEETEPLYKVGINFLVDSKKFNIRDKRFNLNDYQHRLKFKTDANLNLIGTLNNISNYGISILLKDINKYENFFITKGSIIKDIFLEFEEVFFDIGTGTVVDVEFLNNDLLIRVSLSNQFLPLDNLLDLKNEKRLDSVINKLNEDLSIKDHIHDAFKNKIFEYRYILDNIKKCLDTFEEEIKYDDPKIKQINTINILHETNNCVKDRLNNVMLEINKMVNNLSHEDYGTYAKYYKQNLHSLLLSAPINQQLYMKPLGYAGDLELSEYIMNNDYVGKTLFDKFIHKYTTETPIIASYKKNVDHRYRDLKNSILHKLQTQNIVKISAVCSGLCYEIFELIKSDDISDHCDIDLFFTSEATLKYCKKKIENLKHKYNRYTNTNFYFKPMYSIINEPLSQFESDIIYTSNILEYMPDSYFVKLIKNLHNILKKDGVLFINQYYSDFGFKAYFEMGFDWFINYRDIYAIKLLLAQIPELADFKGESQIVDAYLHLKITKKG